MRRNLKPNFPIIAYFPSWTGNVEDIPFDKLTHVNYSFAFPTPTGGLTAIDAKRLGSLMRQGHQHGVKVCLAVGGWNDGDCGAFEVMASKAESRGVFVRNLIELCDRFALDGVDIDWEYPQAHSAGDFVLLMSELDAALRNRGRLLSAAVIAEGDAIGAFIRREIFDHIDFLNIMAYDWNYQQEGTNHSPYSLAESALDYWLGRGCPKEKAVLGLPFYGRSTTQSITYRELVAENPAAAQTDTLDGFHYNGIPTLVKKTTLAMEKAGGVMFWEATHWFRNCLSKSDHNMVGLITC